MEKKEIVEMIMGAFGDTLEEKVTEQVWADFAHGQSEHEALEEKVVEKLSELKTLLFERMPKDTALDIAEGLDMAFTDYSICRQKICYIAGLIDGRNWRGGNGSNSA